MPKPNSFANKRRSRRRFMASSIALTAGLPALPRMVSSAVADQIESADQRDRELAEIASQTVLKLDGLADPLVIESMELLRVGNEFLVRVRTRDGAEGIAVANSSRLQQAYPIFKARVAPAWIGRDARDLEKVLTDVYRRGSNYKWQGLAFWCCVAAAELAVLDLLGRAGGRPVCDLFGGAKRDRLAVYRASSNRGNQPEQEIEHLQNLLEETGGQALKFRLGGRMSNNVERPRGRSEALIPMVRETFGDAVTLYADSNSSYDVPNAIRIGRMMEDHGYAFFEEPCPFDHLWETQQVTQALNIPIAGGEQEFSLRRFRWSLAHDVVDIAQPDLHYFGGFVRSARVAKMANSLGKPCTVHMSGSGLGYVYVLHFAAFVDDPGAHQEYKGLSKIPFECPTSSLNPNKGRIDVPTGPGFGVTIDPAYLKKATPV
ncbi:MAG: mandelate racemase/muconate lactonizing enzyme family protein [Planctomycetota bacterium]